MSRIKEHLVNILNFEEPDYNKEIGDLYEVKLEQLHDIDKTLEAMDYEKFSPEYNKIVQKKDRLIEELNNLEIK